MFRWSMKFYERIVWQADNGRITTRLVPYRSVCYEKADVAGKRLGLGKAILIEVCQSRTVFERVRAAIKDLKSGLEWKLLERYPLPFCCLFQYCLDEFLNRQHTVYRFRNNVDYVPCWIHLRLLGGREKVLDGEW